MSNVLMMLRLNLQSLLNAEDGQDLVEYGLLVSLIALAAITGVHNVASAVTTMYANISTTLTTTLTPVDR